MSHNPRNQAEQSVLGGLLQRPELFDSIGPDFVPALPTAPMVARIDRNPARIAPDGCSRPLQPLFPSVMAGLAQWLPVIDVPKQRLIPLVRGDVVNHCCSGGDV